MADAEADPDLGRRLAAFFEEGRYALTSDPWHEGRSFFVLVRDLPASSVVQLDELVAARAALAVLSGEEDVAICVSLQGRGVAHAWVTVRGEVLDVWSAVTDHRHARSFYEHPSVARDVVSTTSPTPP